MILTGLLLAAALCGLYALAAGQFPIMREEETTARFREPETESETERETEPETGAETQTEPDWEKLREYFKKSVVFPDTIQEDAIRNALGKKRDDEIMFQELKDIKSLFFCGSTWQTDLSRVEFNENGELTVNGAPAAKGPVSDLSLIGSLLNLEELALMGQPVEDLSDLKGLPLLKELNLSGSDVSDLSGLQDLPGLETIHLEHSKVQDLMPLAHVPRLKKVTVSADMLPLQLDPDAKYDVVLVK